MKKIIISVVLFFSSFHSKAQNWLLSGNSGTNPSTNFIGTLDNQPLIFKTNNTEVFRLASTDGVATFNSVTGTGAIFNSSYYSGSFIRVNSNSANPSTISGYRIAVNNTLKSQIFYNPGAYAYGTAVDGLVGNTEILSRLGDVLLSTNNFRTNSVILKNSTGYLGLGTLTPQNKLEITQGTAGNSGLRFTNLTATSTANASSGKVLSVDANGNVVLEQSVGVPTSYWDISTLGTNNIINNNLGGVIIGTGISNLPTTGYKLYVTDGIITEKLKIRLKASWPDYVFNNNYQLQPLTEIENYININKHLPGMQSAEDVKKEGIEVGETNLLLLKKIEELTLYLIKADKEIKELQKKMDAFNK